MKCLAFLTLIILISQNSAGHEAFYADGPFSKWYFEKAPHGLQLHLLVPWDAESRASELKTRLGGIPDKKRQEYISKMVERSAQGLSQSENFEFYAILALSTKWDTGFRLSLKYQEAGKFISTYALKKLAALHSPEAYLRLALTTLDDLNLQEPNDEIADLSKSLLREAPDQRLARQGIDLALAWIKRQDEERLSLDADVNTLIPYSTLRALKDTLEVEREQMPNADPYVHQSGASMRDFVAALKISPLSSTCAEMLKPAAPRRK